MIERQLKILKILSSHDGPISSEKISKYLQVSRKTIFSDIENIKTIAKKHNVEIVNIPSKGINISSESENDLINLENELKKKIDADKYSTENRRIFIIKQLYLTKNDVTLDNLSEEYMVSKTSIYNDIKTINKLIKDYGSETISNSTGIIIIGEEINIQRSLIEIIFHYCNDTTFLNSIKEVQLTFFEETIVNKIYEELFIKNESLIANLPDYYIQSFLTSVIVLCSRAKLDFHIEKEMEFNNDEVDNYEENTVINFIEFLEQDLGIEFTKYDVLYIKKHLFAHRLVDSQIINNSFNTRVINKFIEQMGKIEGVNFIKNDEFVGTLTYHISAMILRLKLGIHIQNPLLKSLREQYKSLFSVLHYSVNILEDHFNIKLNDDEISLILIYFQIQIEALKKANNILIICQYGVSCAQLIYNRVRVFLPEEDNISIKTIEYLANNSLHDVDFIITSINLDFLNLEIPYVLVNPVVNNDDYIRIISEYTKTFNKKFTKKINKRNKSTNMIKTFEELLTTETIFIKEKFANKNDLINNIGSYLEGVNLVKSSYIQSILAREKMGITALEYGVALPHASPKTVKKTHIAICTLDKPIDWDGIKTSLVIFINFSHDDINDIRFVVDTIYKKINSVSKVKELVKSNTKIDLLEKFRRI